MLKRVRFFSFSGILISLGLFLGASAKAQNLVQNGSLEQNFTGWTNLAGDGATASFSLETTDVQDGTKALKVQVDTLGANEWSIQSLQTTWTAQLGQVYVLRFYAKAAVAGAKIRVLQQTNEYKAEDFTLTTEWAPYVWEYTAVETTPQLKFQYFQTGTFYIDNVTLASKVPNVQKTTDTIQVLSNTTYQTLEGFGGAIAFYNNWVTAHPNKEEIYQLLFDDLGLDWLRIRNSYNNDPAFTTEDVEFVEKAKQYNPAAKVLMASWSPPAALKDIASTDSGTLAKENGQFVYGKYAKYWEDALKVYAALGVKPDMISIQNEPDWQTTAWETNKFLPTETAEYPGYDKALDSVYHRIKNLPDSPKIIGAEPLGIGYNRFDEFTTPIKDRDFLYGYAYHLYHGGDPSSPDSYNTSLANIATNYTDRPNFMTEYELYDHGWLKTAWLVNNVLTKANASAFFYWNVVWPDKGLIDIETPFNTASWTTTKGYSVNPHYYAFKHFSKPLSGGYQRIASTNHNDVIRTSAYVNAAKNEIVAVIVHVGAEQVKAKLSFPGWKIDSSTVYQTAHPTYYTNLGALPQGDSLVLPDSSITTLVLHVEADPLSLFSTTRYSRETEAKAFPNPFNKELQVAVKGHFEYQLYTLSGQLLEAGQGTDQVAIGSQAKAGMYVVKVRHHGKEEILKASKY